MNTCLVYVPCNIWNILVLKQLFIVYLKFKIFGYHMFYLATPFIHKYNQENSFIYYLVKKPIGK